MKDAGKDLAAGIVVSLGQKAGVLVGDQGAVAGVRRTPHMRIGDRVWVRCSGLMAWRLVPAMATSDDAPWQHLAARAEQIIERDGEFRARLAEAKARTSTKAASAAE